MLRPTIDSESLHAPGAQSRAFRYDRARKTARPATDGVAIRVVVTNVEPGVRAHHTAALNAARDLLVVGEAGTGQEAVSAVERHRPDVILMDFSMQDLDGRAAVSSISAAGKITRVIALTADEDIHFFSHAIKAGASGCLLNTASVNEVIDAVRAVARGDLYLGARPARVVPRSDSLDTPDVVNREIFERLTHRERGVLLLIAQGFSAREIGERLFISAKTVDTYKQRIQAKTGLAHRPEYVQFAWAMGMQEVGWRIGAAEKS